MPYGKGRYGGTIYAGQSGEDPPPPVPVVSVRAGSQLGCGEWSAYIADRGGSVVRWQVPWASLEAERVRNASARHAVTLGLDAESYATCCEILTKVEPWQHELHLYRDNHLAHVGPVIQVQGTRIVASDLYAWMGKRIVDDDLRFSMDAALVFDALFRYLRDKDDSMNVSILHKSVGVDVLRTYLGADKRRGSDLLSELGRSAVDFTVTGRTVLVGDLTGFMAATPPLLLDDGVVTAEVSKLGAELATDIAITGATLTAGGNPVQGRAQAGSTRYGLLQESYSEPLIADPESADANAERRLMEQQPAPRVVDATLSPLAAVNYEDILGGMRFDVRLAQVSGCIPVNQVMEADRVSTRVSASDNGLREEINTSLVPLTVAGD